LPAVGLDLVKGEDQSGWRRAFKSSAAHAVPAEPRFQARRKKLRRPLSRP
jgi:hypothetical protein